MHVHFQLNLWRLHYACYLKNNLVNCKKDARCESSICSFQILVEKYKHWCKIKTITYRHVFVNFRIKPLMHKSSVFYRRSNIFSMNNRCDGIGPCFWSPCCNAHAPKHVSNHIVDFGFICFRLFVLCKKVTSDFFFYIFGLLIFFRNMFPIRNKYGF